MNTDFLNNFAGHLRELSDNINPEDLRGVIQAFEQAADIIQALAKDKERMDWLETQDCWIGLYGEYQAKPVHACGKNYREKVREVCDKNLTNN